MTPHELKSSILQLAIQGKLVEQCPEEGTGEELFQQVQIEKQRLIKAGKIKKEKPFPEYLDDDIPFDIPESWTWVRIAQLVTLNPKNDLEDDAETAFAPMPCVMDGFRNQHTYEVKKWKEIKKGFTHFAEGDIAVAKITPCFQNRKSVIFRNLPNGYGAGTTELTVMRTVNETVSSKYLLWFFKTDYFISNGVKSFTGTAGQQRVHKDYIATCLIPLPPLAEQKRIVARIEELIPLIDRYEQAWSKLENLNKRFPVDIQKSILQMAIQGKLVEQRPEEGTGEELYRQIQAEKQALIKAGKIKKEKPLPDITDDEMPYDIPDTWKWIRLAEVVTLENGDRSSKYPVESDYVPFGIPFFGAKDMDGRYMSFESVRYISEAKFNELGNGKLRDRDFICLLRGSVGKIAMFAADEKHSTGFICAQMVIVRSLFPELVDYLYMVMTSPYYYRFIEANTTGTAVRQLPAKKLGEIIIPLPPLEEQKRIVSKLEEILPLCERLK